SAPRIKPTLHDQRAESLSQLLEHGATYASFCSKRYRRTVLLFEGEGVVTLVTKRVPTARDNRIVRVGRDSYQASQKQKLPQRSRSFTEVCTEEPLWHF